MLPRDSFVTGRRITDFGDQVLWQLISVMRCSPLLSSRQDISFQKVAAMAGICTAWKWRLVTEFLGLVPATPPIANTVESKLVQSLRFRY